jgi:histidinol-phosphate aminotransferase
MHRYPDSSAVVLREALARHANLTPEMVVCSNGSDELVLLLCLAFLREGDEAVMAEGTFISYLLRTREMGAQAVRVPLKDYTHDLPAMAAAVTPRTRVLIVMDEAYYEFVTRPDYPDLLPDLRQGRSNLILLRTFAKMHGLAGLRLGYGFGHPDIIDYLHRARAVFNVNMLAQVAGVAALSDTEHMQRSREHANASRAFFVREIEALGLHVVPGETNFVAVDVGDDTAVAEGLRERGFTVTPLSAWGVPGSIRVSFGTSEQNERFIAALKDTLTQQPTSVGT